MSYNPSLSLSLPWQGTGSTRVLALGTVPTCVTKQTSGISAIPAGRCTAASPHPKRENDAERVQPWRKSSAHGGAPSAVFMVWQRWCSLLSSKDGQICFVCAVWFIHLPRGEHQERFCSQISLYPDQDTPLTAPGISDSPSTVTMNHRIMES